MTTSSTVPRLDLNTVTSESLEYVADLFESGAISWTPLPLDDGTAFTLLQAVNQFAADLEPANQLLPPRWG